ncbi:hypothetical protein I2I11_11190 [Pontibacter sp. 172403-2]|uniref:hypothetical protein n=1 Tax=Pontibacter rufus TaxID=2791028 RepID=UPI0018AFE787|nr:hypothetical protein [Pontibacter sp. 172403-2]MBF9253858.1 hypothetical protein [Pontibacter sp. 172403-2]
MRKLEIIVEDQDYHTLKHILQHIDIVKSIVEKDVEEKRERIDVTGNKYNQVHKPNVETQIPYTVDEVTLMSQPSLAEEWDSEEDSVWDQYYKETKSAEDSTSQS